MNFLDRVFCLNNNDNLFYNNSGDKRYYKMAIKHISFSENLCLSKIFSNQLKVKKDFYIVDLDKEEISQVKAGDILKIHDLEL